MPPHTTSPFLDACRGRPVERVPVWFMRQAGRSLPEYRAVRAAASMFDIVGDPALAAEVTMQPVRRLGVDAAILFSDIVVPLVAIGVGIELREGLGPVLNPPFRGPDDLRRLRPLEPEADIAPVLDTVRLVTKECDVPLIGCAGAPFTLASYLVEGGPSKTQARTKALMHSDPDTWSRLLDALADISLASLRAQVAAGAVAVQVFDSWAGSLTPDDYRRSVLAASRPIFAGLDDLGVPRIPFGVGTGELLALIGDAGADVVGVDWRVPLDEAARRVGPARSLQGNLDPAVLLADRETVDREVRRVVEEGRAARGHVFNLGHGVLPETDPGALTHVVDLVHELSRR